jgi:thioesterase domain-containing protein
MPLKSQWQRTLRRVDLAKRVLEYIIAVLVLLFLGLLGHAAYGRGRDLTVIEQHREIDTIYVPRFYAAWSEWTGGHPQDKPGLPGSHFAVIDAGDVKRGHAMHEAMRELEQRLGAIGY